LINVIRACSLTALEAGAEHISQRQCKLSHITFTAAISPFLGPRLFASAKSLISSRAVDKIWHQPCMGFISMQPKIIVTFQDFDFSSSNLPLSDYWYPESWEGVSRLKLLIHWLITGLSKFRPTPHCAVKQFKQNQKKKTNKILALITANCCALAPSLAASTSI
jgi:hypothetical protein